MNELKVFEKNGQLLTDSREVAKMIDRPHYDLMKAIRSYCDYLNEGNFPLVDFFLESTYPDSKGEIRPCYLLTKKGCDMVANKLTGQKGVLFTAAMSPPLNRCESVLKPAKHSQTTNPASSAPCNGLECSQPLRPDAH